MNKSTHLEDKSYFRRQFPRRAMKRHIGILSQGHYFVCETGEIGEGGVSIVSEIVLTEGREVVLSFQIPGGDFVFLRASVLSTQKKVGESASQKNTVTHGLSFSDIAFALKRQIRAFVSARNEASGF